MRFKQPPLQKLPWLVHFDNPSPSFCLYIRSCAFLLVLVYLFSLFLYLCSNPFSCVRFFSAYFGLYLWLCLYFFSPLFIYLNVPLYFIFLSLIFCLYSSLCLTLLVFTFAFDQIISIFLICSRLSFYLSLSLIVFSFVYVSFCLSLHIFVDHTISLAFLQSLSQSICSFFFVNLVLFFIFLPFILSCFSVTFSISVRKNVWFVILCVMDLFSIV